MQAKVPVATPNVTLGFSSLPELFNMIVNFLIGIGIAATVIFLIMGGIKYISSQGDQKGVQAAREAITSAVIGFVIVISAVTIKAIAAGVIGAGSGGVSTVTSF